VSLQHTDSGRITILTPDAALVAAHLAPLQEELRACIAAGRTRIVLDLGPVPFIDSRGLELLLDASRRLRAAGGRLKLVNPNPLCSEILTATRLVPEIEVYFDLHQAGRSFR
jgi:anti-sigma B factor antagonist